jgi:hypothetical protein
MIKDSIMSMDQAAMFLAGSVLTIMGLVVIVAGCIIINNLVHRFWKPVRVFTTDSFTFFGYHHQGNSVRFAEPHELDQNIETKVK